MVYWEKKMQENMLGGVLAVNFFVYAQKRRRKTRKKSSFGVLEKIFLYMPKKEEKKQENSVLSGY